MLFQALQSATATAKLFNILKVAQLRSTKQILKFYFWKPGNENNIGKSTNPTQFFSTLLHNYNFGHPIRKKKSALYLRFCCMLSSIIVVLHHFTLQKPVTKKVKLANKIFQLLVFNTVF